MKNYGLFHIPRHLKYFPMDISESFLVKRLSSMSYNIDVGLWFL